jgi:hypothetical protein
VDIDLARPRWRFTATYAFTPRLQAGLEYNPVAGEVGFIGNWIAHLETEKLPMVNFGTSSDRIGTPPGPKAYYVTFAKSIPSLRAAPYVSINYSEHDRGINFPFGVNFVIDRHWSILPMNDGRKTHLTATYSEHTWSVTALWIWLKHPGISFSMRF